MNRLYYILALTIFYNFTYSQNVSGTVFGIEGTNKEALSGVILQWVNTGKGTTTDSNGKFVISSEGITDKRIAVTHVGYKKDTIAAGDLSYIEILLQQNLTTKEITIEDEKKSTYFGSMDAKTEIITSNELVKDACCDLSGCFGRNSSVDVAVTDILTDSKELKVLGLDGTYTQILLENMPVITGLNSKFSISSIPGTLIDKIMITKGANSVLHGYENISGIINILLKDSKTSDRIFLNAFINSSLEKQINANFTNDFSKKWNSILTFHTTQKPNRVDVNNDGFLDKPLLTRYMVFNKWQYGEFEDKTQFSIAGKIWNEERIGGQKDFDVLTDKGSSNIYGQTVNINSNDIYTRFSRQLGRNNSIKIIASNNYYEISSYYGTTKYTALQDVFNTNLIYEMEIFRENFLKTGISYKFEKIDENINFTQPSNKSFAGRYFKIESVPGIFTEHSVNFFDEKASLMSGIRWDYHNKHKNIITPRMLLRYKPAQETVLRASIGTGFRTPEIFNEYSTLFASSKDLIIPEELLPEKMLNYGIDIIQYFDFYDIAGSLNLDIYRTEFYNKIIPDYDSDPVKVFFSNSGSKAYSNIFQAELNLNLFRYFDIKTAYKFVEIKYTLHGKLVDQPFNAKHRLLSTFSFTTPNKSWNASCALQWFGKAPLPSTSLNPPQYQRPSVSDGYALVNAQVNKNFNFIEVYAGAENLFDYTQENPIISSEDPFSQYFDTSFIWGPTKGREFYAGIRLKFN